MPSEDKSRPTVSERGTAAFEVLQPSLHQQQSSAAGGFVRRIASGSKSLLGAVVFLLGLLITAVSFYSSLEATPGLPLDEKYDFSTPFSVRNTGLFPLFAVRFSCTHHLVIARPFIFKNTAVTPSQEPIPTLWPQDVHTVQCHLPDNALFKVPAGPLQVADISIVVRFRNVFWYPVSRRLRFRATRDSAGELRWFPRAPEAS
jgi:hypothetical protein